MILKKNRKSEEYEASLIKSISATGVLESQGKDKSWKGEDMEENF